MWNWPIQVPFMSWFATAEKSDKSDFLVFKFDFFDGRLISMTTCRTAKGIKNALRKGEKREENQMSGSKNIRVNRII